MSVGKKQVRVLCTFPHKLGAGQICYTAWEQVRGLAAAGVDVLVHTGVLHRAIPEQVTVVSTLARGRLRIPYNLVRHIYGYDQKRFYPNPVKPDPKRGLTLLFVGVCAVRKGLHFALEAWLQSRAHETGAFLIAGEFISVYEEKLKPMLSHPNIRGLGHREDIPQLMRDSDVMVLPSIEEGFGLVCTEALGSGSVPLVSDACTDLCRRMENSLVHKVADVAAITQHLNMLHDDRDLLQRLRDGALASCSVRHLGRGRSTPLGSIPIGFELKSSPVHAPGKTLKTPMVCS